MLQDLSQGRLENEFHIRQITEDDIVLCIREGEIALHRDAEDRLTLPRWRDVSALSQSWNHWEGEGFRYLFRMGGENYFLWMGAAGDCPGYPYTPVRPLRQQVSREVCYAIMTGWHLYNWYRVNRFCGACGSPTVHDSKERMLRCPHCGNMIFPRISPAVIVAVTDGDRLLLTKYAGRAYSRYALIAGFTEIGETVEQTVHREAMEEVGLKVKNLRYYKSQPWGVDGNVLMGFYCDLDGDDTVHLDTRELAVGEWHTRGSIPARDDGISLTREMIRIFDEGREPR